MPTVSEFNLRTLVRQVLDDSVLTDPGLIAEEVYRRTAAKDRGAAYQQALRHFVRQVASEQRGATTITAGPSKATRAREWWQRSMRDRIHVNGDAGWKMLADCTRDDLLYAAAERREQADRNRAKAQQYEALASLLDANSAATVRDLPADVLMRALGGAA